jgi:hypothetical protein
MGGWGGARCDLCEEFGLMVDDRGMGCVPSHFVGPSGVVFLGKQGESCLMVNVVNIVNGKQMGMRNAPTLGRRGLLAVHKGGSGAARAA